MRQYIRHPSDIPIVYDFMEFISDQKEYLKDISVGGLCFRSRIAIPQGTCLTLQIPLTHPVFRAKGMVTWCRPQQSCYEIGVQFLDEQTEFRARMVEQVCYIEHYKRDIFEKEGRVLSGEDAAVEWIQKYASHFPGSRLT